MYFHVPKVNNRGDDMILEIQEIINNLYELKNTIKEIGESL
ncbi:peptide ABC transporter substrate-binding protein [Clostridium botulinum B2 128]|nr:peptide ABC transporter substrate-binding protein [Clostridium botulinum B2 128]KEI92912.1 peptide ABC transporter substrate-binding protein [Clostridium botulinum B2 433]